MARRLPASMRTREELTSLIEGRLFTASAKDAGLLRAWSPSRTGLPERISERSAKDRRGGH
jgi:hypothetical protein